MRGQGSVGIGTQNPDQSALLDIKSDKKGILIPRMSLEERNSITLPETSLLIFQTDNQKGYYYNSGTAMTPIWRSMSDLHLPYERSQLGSNIALFNLISSGGENGVAIRGASSSSFGIGISGIGTGSNGIGVYGNSSNRYGGLFESSASSGAGVKGINTSFTGNNYGVYGESNGPNSCAIYGLNLSQTGNAYAGKFITHRASGVAIHGWAISETGNTKGGEFTSSSSSSGIALTAHVSSPVGNVTGAIFSTISESGAAAKCISASSTGTTYGLRSLVLSQNGFSGYFEGGKFHVKSRVGLRTVLDPVFALELPNNTNYYTGKARAFEWETYSDARIKSNVKPLSYGLNEVMEMEPVSYFHHNSVTGKENIVIQNDGTDSFGFLAQDLYRIIPEVVSRPENEATDLWSMSYEKLIPVLVQAIKQQQTMIEQLSDEISEINLMLKKHK